MLSSWRRKRQEKRNKQGHAPQTASTNLERQTEPFAASSAASFDPLYEDYCRSFRFLKEDGHREWVELIKISASNWQLQKQRQDDDQSTYDLIETGLSFADGVLKVQAYDRLSQQQGYEKDLSESQWAHVDAVCRREQIVFDVDGQILQPSLSGHLAVTTSDKTSDNQQGKETKRDFWDKVEAPSHSTLSSYVQRIENSENPEAAKPYVEFLKGYFLIIEASRDTDDAAWQEFTKKQRVLYGHALGEIDPDFRDQKHVHLSDIEAWGARLGASFKDGVSESVREQFLELILYAYKRHPDLIMTPSVSLTHYQAYVTTPPRAFKSDQEAFFRLFERKGVFKASAARQELVETYLSHHDFESFNYFVQRDYAVDLTAMSQKTILSAIFARPRLLPYFNEKGFDLSQAVSSDLLEIMSLSSPAGTVPTIWTYLVDRQNKWPLIHYALGTEAEVVLFRSKEDLSPVGGKTLIHLAREVEAIDQYGSLLRSSYGTQLGLDEKGQLACDLFGAADYRALGILLSLDPMVAQTAGKESLLGFELLSSPKGEWFIDLIRTADLLHMTDKAGRTLHDWLYDQDNVASLKVLESLRAETDFEADVQGFIHSGSWKMLTHWVSDLEDGQADKACKSILTSLPIEKLPSFYAMAEADLVDRLLDYPQLLSTDHFIAMARNGRDLMHIVDYAVGMDLNLHEAGIGGETLLHEAARQGNIPVSERLLLLGANPRQKDASGLTFLSIARLQGNAQLISLVPNETETQAKKQVTRQGVSHDRWTF